MAIRRAGGRGVAWSLLFCAALAAGCGARRLPGLQPEYPLVVRKMSAPLGEFVVVDSLRPTLRWQPFPGPGPRGGKPPDALDHIRDLRYELRVWRTTNGHSGTLVFRRDDIEEPSCELFHPLAPDLNYLWTVRARFSLDGRTYVTEWGLSSLTLRNHVVPNPSCFRFRTPGPEAEDGP